MPSYVITGASRGLGYAFVKALAADHSNQVIGLVRNKKAAEARLASDGITNVHVLAADITDEPALTLAAEEARRILDSKGLDVLINNASVVSEGFWEFTSLKDFEGDTGKVGEEAQRCFDVNFLGTMKATFAFLPLIREGGLKKVVAISSGMADIDLINEVKIYTAAPYAASKAALNILIAKFHASYADEGILFMSLCPGLVNTTEGETPALSDEDFAKLKAALSRFEAYAPGTQPLAPAVAAKNCLAAVERSTLEGGFGGSFLSHNGTKRWL